jgi:hypothetical protein
MLGGLTNPEQVLEWKFEGETEIFGKNVLQCRFVHHMT